MGKVFVGHDWAEGHHDLFIENEAGERVGVARVPEGVEGVRRTHELIGAHVDHPEEVTVATETDRGLFVAAMVAAGYRVIAVNPMSTSRYRQRLSTSGAKSDPGDARVLADLARLDGHQHSPRSTPAPEPEPSTTNDEGSATPTTVRCAPWPTGSSASCTAA